MAQFADPNVDTNAQRVVLAAGTAAEPSLTWANDLSKGFYYDSITNEIIAVGFSAGVATDLSNVVAPAAIPVPILEIDGSATEPSYSFFNAQGTGMYRILPNGALGFTKNGVRGILMSTTGNSQAVTYEPLYITSGGMNGVNALQYTLNVSPGATNIINLDHQFSIITVTGTNGGKAFIDRVTTWNGSGGELTVVNLWESVGTGIPDPRTYDAPGNFLRLSIAASYDIKVWGQFIE